MDLLIGKCRGAICWVGYFKFNSAVLETAFAILTYLKFTFFDRTLMCSCLLFVTNLCGERDKKVTCANSSYSHNLLPC